MSSLLPVRSLSRRAMMIRSGLLGTSAFGLPRLLEAKQQRPSKLSTAAKPGHPRLYFTAGELPGLRALRQTGRHRKIWNNIRRSADACLKRSPRKAWIAPVKHDPIYENLYDRFYAMMGDLAVTEHLSFAYALSGDLRYGNAARDWVLASCRAWQREADGEPSASKAYAVARLLKGLAVGYDIGYDRFSPAQQTEVRDTLVRICRKYFTGYFATPTISGAGYHTHHAIVEWGSFGVAALALTGEVAEADRWLAATVKKFEDHLLPNGLAPDGAQIEGATFWASTMQYRLFFMDALRHVTGRDLFDGYKAHMNADLALASVAAEKRPGHNRSHETVVLEPPYGQLDYYAPILLCLAREYRRPLFQHLAMWDHSLGQIQETRYITPHGEQLLFELGGYAYLWYDPTVPEEIHEAKRSYDFPSVGQAYARASWDPGDLLVAAGQLVAAGESQLVVHAGGRPVLVSSLPVGHRAQLLSDDGSLATIRVGNAKATSLTIQLHRPDRIVLRRQSTQPWQCWCHGAPAHASNQLTWGEDVALKVVTGDLVSWEPVGHVEKLAVGFGALSMVDPLPAKFPRVTVKPSVKGEILIEVRQRVIEREKSPE